MKTEIDPKESSRSEAFKLWMTVPLPMVMEDTGKASSKPRCRYLFSSITSRWTVETRQDFLNGCRKR